MNEAVPVIGPEEKFYGYIIGLASEPWDEESKVSTRMYATFEYNNERTVYRVPDASLFEILSGHLCGMAAVRERTGGDDYGYDKLWIQKRSDGNWSVQLP